MSTDRLRERTIRRTLLQLSRQRVVGILQPGDVWVVELAPKRSEETQAALRTCHLRGWVEVVSDAVPTGSLTPDGTLPPGDPFSGAEPIYRLTEGGWNAINRTHAWVVAACVIAFASFIAGVVSVVVSAL